MPFDLDPSLLVILLVFGFLAAFIDSVVGGGGLIVKAPPALVPAAVVTVTLAAPSTAFAAIAKVAVI